MHMYMYICTYVHIYICTYNDTQNVLNDLRNSAYWIVLNKTLSETAKGNFKNTLIQ